LSFPYQLRLLYLLSYPTLGVQDGMEGSQVAGRITHSGCFVILEHSNTLIEVWAPISTLLLSFIILVLLGLDYLPC